MAQQYSNIGSMSRVCRFIFIWLLHNIYIFVTRHTEIAARSKLSKNFYATFYWVRCYLFHFQVKMSALNMCKSGYLLGIVFVGIVFSRKTSPV